MFQPGSVRRLLLSLCTCKQLTKTFKDHSLCPHHCWQPRGLPPLIILQEDNLSNLKTFLPPSFGRACHRTVGRTVAAWASHSQTSLLPCLPYRLKDREGGSRGGMT